LAAGLVISRAIPIGMNDQGWLARPASSNSTLLRGSADSRFATAAPAEPATMPMGNQDRQFLPQRMPFPRSVRCDTDPWIELLLDNVAKQWNVPLAELSTEPSVVVHAKSGRRIGYGEIVAFAEIPAVAPEIKPEALKLWAEISEVAAEAEDVK
jgi:hypothetical protein